MRKNDNIRKCEEKFVASMIAMRTANHMTQEDLAEATGISINRLQKIEALEYYPHLYELNKIANALDCNIVLTPD